jgi:murein DD-endopeptidase MepM/ murein hydrolase activator NlpD
MFFRRKESSARPTVKKVSELVKNTKSPSQKKYISLMLVPSYSTGKTRSLRIPRAVLYGFTGIAFVIFTVITGFYLSSRHHERNARTVGTELKDVQDTFRTFQDEAETAQGELIDATTQMEEQLSEEQMRAQEEIRRQESLHRDALEDIWELIDELEGQIREFEELHHEVVSDLSSSITTAPTVNLLSYTPDFGTQSALDEDGLLTRINSLKNDFEIQRQLLDNLVDYKEQVEPYLSNYPTIWPVDGQISSGFGLRGNPFGRGGNEYHNGIDIPAKTGTPIRAAGGGTVAFQGRRNGYGNVVELNHGEGITTVYAHNTRNNVSEGQRVERGDIIAYVGSTGRSTGSHLHYEVQRNGTAVNPLAFLSEVF